MSKSRFVALVAAPALAALLVSAPGAAAPPGGHLNIDAVFVMTRMPRQCISIVASASQ